MHTVYAIRDTGKTEVRYIGQTTKPAKRFYAHRIYGRKMPRPTAFALWLRDADIEMFVIDTFDTLSDATIAEKMLIEQFATAGHRLFNMWSIPKHLRQPRYIDQADAIEAERAA